MKGTKLGVVVLILLVLLISFSLSRMSSNKPIIIDNSIEESDLIVEVTRSTGEIQNIKLEDYIIGVVAAEMPASFEKEALKAQAIASRTYVASRGFRVDDSIASQTYIDINEMNQKWGGFFDEHYTKIKEAVLETTSQVLMYNNEYISALFFSTSNGKTENNEDYFNSVAIPYLRSVDSPWDLSISNSAYSQKKFSINELKNIFDVERVSFMILSYKDSGRVDEVLVGDKVYTGREIRELLGLSSSDFEILEDNQSYIFSTVGYGHGVGMSQYGAHGMAIEGYKYQDILTYYYSDVEIVQIK
jgi:stage II sporulation protein D